MKRDLGLVRELLQRLEVLPMGMYDAVTIGPDSPKIAVDGYNEEDIAYHLSPLQERGLVEVPDGQPMIGIVFTRLTWEGHDFLDAVRDSEIWKKTKQGADAVGSFSFDLVKQLAAGFIKTKIEEHTGVKL
jgi:Hypothetical protein (DUF2513)